MIYSKGIDKKNSFNLSPRPSVNKFQTSSFDNAMLGI